MLIVGSVLCRKGGLEILALFIFHTLLPIKGAKSVYKRKYAERYQVLAKKSRPYQNIWS